jgi:hypothetical protein
MIQSVPSDDLRSSDEPLRRQLEKIVAAEDKLTALVQESKADGVLDPNEVASMWQATVSYLKLNPRHAKIAGMQQQLEARIQKVPGQYAAFTELADFWPTQPAAVLSPIIRDLPLLSNTLEMEFKPIIGGTFTMGEANDDDDGPAHQVTLTQPPGAGERNRPESVSCNRWPGLSTNTGRVCWPGTTTRSLPARWKASTTN